MGEQGAETIGRMKVGNKLMVVVGYSWLEDDLQRDGRGGQFEGLSADDQFRVFLALRTVFRYCRVVLVMAAEVCFVFVVAAVIEEKVCCSVLPGRHLLQTTSRRTCPDPMTNRLKSLKSR